MSDLAKRLRIKAGMIEMGERIAWGSDSALMREAADALEMAAPAVQGEPVAVMYEDGSLLSKADCGDNFEICCKVQTPLYAAPQPAEQKPAPDVAGLVQQHHRDSAELRRLCQARDEQRDGRLAALERAAKAEADVTALVEALEAVVAYDEEVEDNDGNLMMHYSKMIRKVREALAAHRKQEPGHD